VLVPVAEEFRSSSATGSSFIRNQEVKNKERRRRRPSLVRGMDRKVSSSKNFQQKEIVQTNGKKKGPTGIRTQVARFKVWSANHYTMEPISMIVLFHILLLLPYIHVLHLSRSELQYLFVTSTFFTACTKVSMMKEQGKRSMERTQSSNQQ
jgi:hypothetical protein